MRNWDGHLRAPSAPPQRRTGGRRVCLSGLLRLNSSRSLNPARQRGARPGRRPCCWRNEGSCLSRPAPPVPGEARTGQGREGSTLEAEAEVAEPGQPEEELLEEQPQALPSRSHWKGNGSVCSQFPELARSSLLKNVKVNAEQLQTLQTVET